MPLIQRALRFRLELLVALTSALVGCGGSGADDAGEAEVATDDLVAVSDAVCPAGTTINAEYRLCEGNGVAVGPFPHAMVSACRARGETFCLRAYWPIEVAHELRGTEYCPPGTTLDDDLGVCATMRFAYGPFSREMIAYCRDRGGGSECYAMEWRREWVPAPADNAEAAGGVERDETPPRPLPRPKTPTPPRAGAPEDDDGDRADYEARHDGDEPIAPESDACHAADGYSGGRRVRICVVNVDGKLVEKDTARQYRKMQAAAREDGVHLVIVSGFRTMAKQEQLYALYKSGRGNLAARPGYSNHQSGSALDLNARATGVYAWLGRHGAEHGFRRTVPSEPWHWDAQ